MQNTVTLIVLTILTLFNLTGTFRLRNNHDKKSNPERELIMCHFATKHGHLSTAMRDGKGDMTSEIEAIDRNHLFNDHGHLLKVMREDDKFDMTSEIEAIGSNHLATEHGHLSKALREDGKVGLASEIESFMI